MSLIELSRKEIDENKWNNLLQKSSNSLIYHSIAFLDTMANNWSALVMNDYEYAMPLTQKKLLAYTFLQQPHFIQQLGIIGNDITIENIQLFINYLEEKYDYIHYAFNYNNAIPHLIQRNNFILSLNNSYNSINQDYNDDALNNLKKSNKISFAYIENINPGKSIHEFKKYYGSRFKHVKNTSYNKLIDYCVNNKQSWLSREVYKGNELCASCLLLKDSKRLYFLINYVSKLGRDTEANYFLIDQLIQEFSDSSLLLDFEGSDLKGVKEFYQKFGTVNQPFYILSKNKLPFLFKIFKK